MHGESHRSSDLNEILIQHILSPSRCVVVRTTENPGKASVQQLLNNPRASLVPSRSSRICNQEAIECKVDRSGVELFAVTESDSTSEDEIHCFAIRRQRV